MCSAPVLLVIFNRPDVTRKTMQSIRTAKPGKLYVSCDGPRIGVDDYDLIEKTKKIVFDMIDWNCKVYTNFHDKNLGCGLAVHTAIQWMFEQEEYGIILEDDCVAQLSFFSFAEELLVKYQNDERIGMIAGTNPITNYTLKKSYCFSKYKACWGWATWKRAWKNMDLSMNWLKDDKKNVLSNMGYFGKDIPYWVYRLKLIKMGEVSAWDWQWYYSLARQNQLCIFPKYSLISNIGFGKAATHTFWGQNKKYLTDMQLEFPLIHQNSVLPDSDFDKYFFQNNNSLYNCIIQYIPVKIKRKVKCMLRKFL